jgi:hypothetical protein
MAAELLTLALASYSYFSVATAAEVSPFQMRLQN